jgi:hypothetical protein
LEGGICDNIAVPADHLECFLRKEGILPKGLEFQASRPIQHSRLRGNKVNAIERKNIMKIIDIGYNLIDNIATINDSDLILSRN